MSDLNEFSDDRPPRPNDTPEETDLEEGTRLISADVSCENCAHKNVCAVYKGIAPMFEQWQASEGEVPFDLNELAVICNYYSETDDPDP